MIRGSRTSLEAIGEGFVRAALECVADAETSAEPRLPLGWNLIRTEYETGDWDGRLESHRRCIDLHVVLEGRERMAVAETDGLSPLGPYSVEEDVQFFAAERAEFIEMGKGDFLVLDAGEAHMPRLAAGAPGRILKLVLKIPVNDPKLAAGAVV